MTLTYFWISSDVAEKWVLMSLSSQVCWAHSHSAFWNLIRFYAVWFSGCMPVQNYRSFCQFTKWCRTRVPSKVRGLAWVTIWPPYLPCTVSIILSAVQILKEIESLRANDEAVREYGIKLGTDMCRKLLEHGCYALHFYTMNLSEAVRRDQCLNFQKIVFNLASYCAAGHTYPGEPGPHPQASRKTNAMDDRPRWC